MPREITVYNYVILSKPNSQRDLHESNLEMFICASDSLERIFNNPQEMLESLREIAKISLICGLYNHTEFGFEFYRLLFSSMFHLFAALIHGISS